MCECTCKCASIWYFVLWLVTIFLVAILIGVSFDSIDLNQAGLLYDQVNLKLEANTIYYPGRYWIGLGKKFIKQPTDTQLLTFDSILCKSADKSDVQVAINVVFKLRPEFLYEHYNAFLNRNYIDIYQTLVKSIVQNTAANYQMNDFIVSREAIGRQMAQAINTGMRTDMYCELVYFQLNHIDLNTNLEKNLVDNFDSKNQIVVQDILKQEQEIQGQIDILVSEADKTSSAISSKANSTANIYLNQAKTSIVQQRAVAQAGALKSFIDVTALNFTQRELNKLLFYERLDNYTFYEQNNNFVHAFDTIDSLVTITGGSIASSSIPTSTTTSASKNATKS